MDIHKFVLSICQQIFALDKELEAIKTREEPSLIEVKCAIDAREDLARPTTTAIENRRTFMEYLKNL